MRVSLRVNSLYRRQKGEETMPPADTPLTYRAEGELHRLATAHAASAVALLNLINEMCS